MPYYNAKKIIQEGILSITFSVVANLAAGSLLNQWLEFLIAVPVLLTLAPSLGGMAGAIGSLFSARLSTALHLGLVRPRIEKNDILMRNLFAVTTIALASSLYLCLATYILSNFAGIGSLSLFDLARVIIMASILVFTVTMTTAVSISFLSFRKNLDPGSATIPIVTSIGDFAAASSLIVAVRILQLA